jgi:hypothetical protein
MSEVKEDDVRKFNENLNDFREKLPPAQQALLDAICRTAWLFGQEGEGTSTLASGFKGSFTAGDAKMMLQYSHGSHGVVAGLIKSTYFRSLIK